MKISATVGQDGKMERSVDFEGALLPDGRSIDEVLTENKTLKEKVDTLQSKLNDTSSILVYLIPNKTVRIVVEITLIVLTVIGVIAIL
jgi:hypothetical protein